MLNKFNRKDNNMSLFRSYLRLAMFSNTSIASAVLSFSGMMTILGGQIPASIINTLLLLATFIFLYLFATKSKWDKSFEHQNTLPISQHLQKKADRCAAVITALPFYAIAILSLLQVYSFEGGTSDPLIFFYIKAVVFYILYFPLQQWAFAGKTKTTISTPLMDMLRKGSGLISLIVLGLIITALNFNSKVYDTKTQKATEHLPQHYTLPARTDPKEWDRLLLLVVIKNIDNSVLFSSTKIITREESHNFSYSLAEFDRGPAVFEKVIIESDSESLKINNYGEVHKAYYNTINSSSAIANWHQGGNTYTRISSPLYETKIFSPWYKRLFSFNKQSYSSIQTMHLTAIPFRNGEKFTNVSVGEITSGAYLWLPAKEHFDENLKSTTTAEYNHEDMGLQQKYFILPLIGLYGLICLLFISMSYALKFNPTAIMLNTGLCAGVFIICDWSNTNSRLNDAANFSIDSRIRQFAVIDLNSTVFFRQYAHRQLEAILTKFQSQITEKSHPLETFAIYKKTSTNLNTKRIYLQGRDVDHRKYLGNPFLYSEPVNVLNDKSNQPFAISFTKHNFLNYRLLNKIINKSGVYHFSLLDFTFYRFSDIDLKTLIKTPLDEDLMIQCVIQLQSDQDSTKGRQILNENLNIRTTLLKHLIHQDGPNEKRAFTSKIIEVTKKQQIEIIINKIHNVKFNENIIQKIKKLNHT